ncbi:hypothetical protein ACWGAN_36595 [Streptomyces sp. NPDC054945]
MLRLSAHRDRFDFEENTAPGEPLDPDHGAGGLDAGLVQAVDDFSTRAVLSVNFHGPPSSRRSSWPPPAVSAVAGASTVTPGHQLIRKSWGFVHG